MTKTQRFLSPVLYPMWREIPVFHFEKGIYGETDLRMALLDAFLNTPYDRLEILQFLHDKLLAYDPVFYGHLASWYSQVGTMRVHKEIFLAYLLTSDFPEHREAAFILLQGFAPHEVSRMMDYCKRVHKKFPRIARAAVVRYLRAREANPRWFDAEVLKGRKYLKHLYASLRIKPDERANRILFMRDPPHESPLGVLKRIGKEKEPAVQARLIFENKIPYHVVINALENIDPALAIPLVNAMSCEELRSSLNALRNRGVLKYQEVKKIVNRKLKEVQQREAVSLNTGRAWRKFEISVEVVNILESLVLDCSQKGMEIQRPTALFIDRSGSMESAMNTGKVVAVLCSSIVKSNFYVYLFNSMAINIEKNMTSLYDWEDVLKSFSPEGSTSVGIPLELMREKNERVEQIIIVTDGNENSSPYLADIYQSYREKLKTSPHIIIVKTGHYLDKFEKGIIAKKIPHTIFDFEYLSLNELVSSITMPSYSEILEEIMATSLPRRKYSKIANRGNEL